jgi:hypothetical protein
MPESCEEGWHAERVKILRTHHRRTVPSFVWTMNRALAPEVEVMRTRLLQIDSVSALRRSSLFNNSQRTVVRRRMRSVKFIIMLSSVSSEPFGVCGATEPQDCH